MDVFETNKLPRTDISFSKIEFERTFDGNEESILQNVHNVFGEVVTNGSETEKKVKGNRIYIPANRSKFNFLQEASLTPSSPNNRKDDSGPFPSTTFPLGHVQGLKPNLELSFRPESLLSLNTQKLKENSEYQEKVYQLLLTMKNEGRHDHFYSWYPNSIERSPTSINNKWKFDTNDPIRSILDLISDSNQYIDEFQENLKTNIIQAITKTINTNMLLPKLLSLHGDINSKLSKLKVKKIHKISKSLNNNNFLYF